MDENYWKNVSRENYTMICISNLLPSSVFSVGVSLVVTVMVIVSVVPLGYEHSPHVRHPASSFSPNPANPSSPQVALQSSSGQIHSHSQQPFVFLTCWNWCFWHFLGQSRSGHAHLHTGQPCWVNASSLPFLSAQRASQDVRLNSAQEQLQM